MEKARTIRVPDEEWKSWRMSALERGTTVTALVREAMAATYHGSIGLPPPLSADRADVLKVLEAQCADAPKAKPSRSPEPKAGSMAAYRKKMGLPE